MFLSFLCLFVGICFVGCADNKTIVPSGNHHTEYEGVYLTIESVKRVDGHINLTAKWHNQTDHEVIYRLPYDIEYKNGEEWTNINIADVNYDLTEISVSPYSVKTQVYTTEYFDVSKAGIYRLRTSYSVSSTSNTYTLWAEFEVKSEIALSKLIEVQFDLTDEKIYWTDNTVDYTDDEILIIFKKSYTYPELKIEDFHFDNAESIDYIFLKPRDESLSANYRQIAAINLKEHGKDKVIEAVKYFERLSIVYAAQPNYIYGIADDNL